MTFERHAMKRVGGITIVRLMVVLLILGIVAKLLVDFVIEKRCETNHASPLCTDRKAVPDK